MKVVLNMKQSKRRSGLILGILLALTMLLAACGGSTSSSAPTTPTATASTASVAGDFVANIPASHAWVGLSTDGRQVLAYTCDGSASHTITFAEWFKGPVTNNAVNLTANDGAHLVASLTSDTATGTITLKGGTSFSFTAHTITDPNSPLAGLYRSEQSFNGVHYLAGWVLLPKPQSAALSASLAWLGGSFVPLHDYPHQGGGIINEQTGALLTAPHFDPETSQQVTVPGLGTFVLTQCRGGTC